MLTFAWITFVLSALLLMLALASFVVAAINGLVIWKASLATLIPFAFGAFGCAQYIFGFTFLPYEFVIGMAFGAAAILAVRMIPLPSDDFDSMTPVGVLMILVCILTVVALVVFFALATVQHFWPHLITF